MADLGFLNFGIGTDGEDLLAKALEEDKKRALEVQKIISSINIGKVGGDELAAMLKEQQKLSHTTTMNLIRQDEARAKSAARLAAITSATNSKELVSYQKLLTEIERTNAAKRRGVSIGSDGQVRFNNDAGLTNKTLFNQKNLLNQISNAAGIYFSVYQVGAFVKNLALVSGEFEMQKISLENILQDVDAANKLFGQIKGLSVVSPFEFKDLVGYAKQLSAFSIPANELYDTTKRLADVSAGLGVDMGRIILAYGQVRSASVLRGQELRQFTEAGIPLVDELAKKFGELEGRVVSAGEVFDKISNRLVPFEMVKEVFTDLTSEGGKFFEMQERQSESLKGKIANLKDAYDIMLYSIGTANDGILKGGVEGITELMKNWENLSSVLIGIIGAIGAYKAAVISKTAIDSLASKGIVYNNALTALSAIVQKKANEVTLGNIALKEKQAIASISLRTCTASEAASEVVLQMAKKTSLSTDAAKLLSETAMITIRRAGNDQTKIAAAVEAIKTSAMRKGLSATVASAIAEGARAAATTASSVATKGLAASLWALMATNPLGWIIGIVAAIGGAAYAIYHFSSETGRAKDSISELIGTEFTTFENMANDLKSLITKLKNVTTGSVEYYQILKEINNKYGEYLPNMDKENDKLLALEKSYNAVTEAIKNKQKQEAYTKANEKVEETYSDDIAKETNDIRKKLDAIGISAKDAAILIKKFNDNVREIGDETSSGGSGSFEERFREIAKEYFGGDSKTWKKLNDISLIYAGNMLFSIRGDIDDLGDALTKKFSMLDFSSNQVDAQFSESFNIKGLTTELENLENAHKETISKINVEYENSGKSRNEIELAIYNSTKEYQKKILQTKFEFGEINAEKLEAGLKQIEKPLSGVKQVVNETIDSIKGLTDAEKHNIKIKDDDTSSVNEYIKALKGQYDSMQENITMMLKMEAVSGVVKLLKSGKAPSPYSEDTVVSAEDVISLENQSKAILAVITALGQLDKKNEKKEAKDPRIELLQKEIGLIKETYGEYDKLSKVMSKPLAMAKVKEQERYKNVNIPSDQQGMLDAEKKYGDKLVALKSKEGKDAAESFYKSYTTGSIALSKDAVDKMMDSVSKEIDKFKDSYAFYEKLLGAGEDKQTAIKIAFGVEFTGNEVDLGKKLSEMVKDASKKVGLEIYFDINKGSIIDQLGDVYNTLTPELKKQIDALEKYRKDKQENTYLEYLSFIQKEVPEGTGVAFDLSSVLTKMKNEVGAIQKKTAEMYESNDTLIDKANIDKAKDLQIKSANDVAANNAKNIGSNFVEQSFKNKMLWENFKNLGDASYGDIKRMIEEVGKLQEETLSKGGISKIFSTGGYTGEKATKEDNSAFSPIVDLLGNTKDVDELNEVVMSLLENINANKEEGVVLDERISGLNDGQIASLRIVLTLIRQMSAALKGVTLNLENQETQRTIDAFKKLSGAATEVIDNIEGLGAAFGMEFDDVTKGALDVIKTIVTSSISVATTITDLVSDSGKAMVGVSESAATAIRTVETASVILAVISAALQIAMKIASIFTGNKTKKADDAIKDQQQQLDDLQRSYDQTEKAADKFYTLEADTSSISKWLTAEKAAINSRYGYLKRFGKMGEEALNSMYKNAEKEAKSMEGASVLQVQEKNLAQQKRALEEQIRAAEGDNKKGKRNDEIDGYRNQLKDLDEQLAETRDQWYETLRGFSMQDIANDFAEAWVEAFEKGEDSIDALDKKFNELIKNMIIKQAAMRVVSKIMQPMMDMIDKAIGEDGIITESEVGGIMGALPDTLKKLDDGMNSIIKPLLEKLGITFGSAAEAGEGLSKGIAGVTEDTANLLASYLNAMRADLSNQKIYLQKIIDAIIPMSNNFALQVAELKKIEANTYRTANNTEKNVEVLNEVKAILKSVTTQGSGKKLNV